MSLFKWWEESYEWWEESYAALKVQINTYLETYEKHYGMLDCKDKIVVDIGADYGSTARFFLSRGARRIIAYESNPVLRAKLLREFLFDGRVEIHGCWDGVMPAGDILKMDCEGCEYKMSELQLNSFKQWAVGLHCPRRLAPEVLQFEAMLRRNGGRMIEDMGFERLWLKK